MFGCIASLLISDHGGSPGRDYSFAGVAALGCLIERAQPRDAEPWRAGADSGGTTRASCAGPHHGHRLGNRNLPRKPHAARRSPLASQRVFKQFPLRCVCLITTTRPASAGPSYFGRQGKAIEKAAPSRPTAPAPFNEDVPPFSTRARKGAGQSGRLSSVVQLTYCALPSSYHRLAALSHTSSPSSYRQFSTGSRCSPICSAQTPPSQSSLSSSLRLPFSRLRLPPYGLTLLDRFSKSPPFVKHVPFVPLIQLSVFRLLDATPSHSASPRLDSPRCFTWPSHDPHANPPPRNKAPNDSRDL
jgi:hypothetical protein